METARLIEVLSHPDAYPHPADAVEVHQTHLSAVFLAGRFAYKVKKPVSFAFVDFSTLARRRHFCDEEIRLNRRLAPGVYLDVVPVCRSDDGGPRIGGDGEVIEWAVKMERLDDNDRLGPRLDRGDDPLDALADRLAEFHRRSDRGPRITEAARFDAIAKNAEANFDESSPLVGRTVSRAVFDRLRAETRSELERLRPRIEARADRGLPCDGHGDIRMDHVYARPDLDPPADLIVVDCIEFNEGLRRLDPISDIAFLVMDLIASGRRAEADRFALAYLDASGDHEGAALLPFYLAYRAAVRGKVEGLATTEAELDEAERSEALAEARGHWLLSLATLCSPADRPGLVLVGGLPGVGKSTLARRLAAEAGFEVIRSDEVRKELAGLPPEASSTAGFEEGIYTPEWTERTYAECLRRADLLLFEGARVVVDASFGSEDQRRRFLGLAARRCVPGVYLDCRAPAGVVRDRLARRSGDVSDADVSIYELAVSRREVPTGPEAVLVDTGGDPDESAGAAKEALREAGLLP
ncbi:bifunctional aminoglycoside phosphotransferase/ATP-binding protein [Tautonia sociabilis]|uniref:Aminoglycoside phosphotransferase domain-containing protein n=1 Tax=Tautonia sociabilis TaxID=2080755 RepID=A0A432MDR8_9BACT|nr:bifunctional aminoglycoside phosphotransferase/ATP-binding protein [Tautonia sociabilis]RUL83080.1 hypothetical protein TsocGM_22840 [Tautonia sociabilis]